MSYVKSVLCVVGVCLGMGEAAAADRFVAMGGTGNGTSGAPFGRIQDALNAAQPGDSVIVRPGTYAESLRTVRGGTAAAPIRLVAEGGRGTVVVSIAARTLRVSHSYIIVDGLILDSQFAQADALVATSAADFLVLRNLEVRRSSRDLIELAGPDGVLIEGSLIHHALNAQGGRTDAHGIVAGPVRNLTIRDTEIHTFSGDGFQIDPDRAAAGWTGVTLERCRIWLGPLPSAVNGFAAGTVPGENAVDTKANGSYPRAVLTIRDTTAWGFRQGLISNMAAFNLKENVDATIDRVTVYDSDIAFRNRGPNGTAGALVTIKNAVIYNVARGFRYENDIQRLHILNSTSGGNVAQVFDDAASSETGLQVRNLLVLGPLPKQASDASNLSVGAAAFVNAGAHNYMLAAGSPAIDTGSTLTAVSVDRAGTSRPQGAAYDVGAYEASSAGGGGGGTGATDIVAYAGQPTAMFGQWQIAPDASAASGAAVWHPNQGAATGAVQAAPNDYFEVTVSVVAGQPYRLWLRGRADGNSNLNDSVFVQFSDSIDDAGNPVYRIGTTAAATVILAECSSCSPSRWGWQDNALGVNALGPLVSFAQSGPLTIRVQTREDGVAIDQIVLSPSTYLTAAPGTVKNDMTILNEDLGTP